MAHPRHIEFRFSSHGARTATRRVEVEGVRIMHEGKMQHLTLAEFAVHLRTHGDDEQWQWGAAILDLTRKAEQLETLQSDIEQALPVAPGQEYADAVQRSAKLGDDVRAVLEECGALAKDDTETDVPALLRALLA